MQDDERACPVCGTADGSCSAGHELPRVPLLSEWAREEQAVDRPQMQVKNPIGPSHPVVVHEQVTEQRPIPGSRRSTHVVVYNPGDRITLEEAERLGVPALDENREPLPGAPQKPKPQVETQEVRGPRQRQATVDRKRSKPRRAPQKPKR
jgi:hypothetical protein